MINPTHFREFVIRPVLKTMDAWSESLENLMMGTAMQESGLTYLKQLGGGPALGIFQMEPDTHDDIWNNYLDYRDDIKTTVSGFMCRDKIERDQEEMVWNLAYATAMCRVHYLRVPESFPHEKDIIGMASYWKQYYNTPLGKGTIDQFVENYYRMLKVA